MPLVRAAIAALLLTACASGVAQGPTTNGAASPTATLQPLVVGWEQFFNLDWQAAERKGRPVVFGHVYNNWGKAAAHVQLLVEGLDATGRVIEQKLAWLGPTLTPGTTAPFEVALREPAAAYRVGVFAFDWVERGRGPHL